jgi:hypothetical protein
MSWATIRDGMKARLATISGLVAYDVMPDNLPDHDVAIVLPGDPLIEPAGHQRKVDINIRVVVRCTRATARDAQDALDAYIWPTGASSIQAAVEAGRTLGGAADDTQFVRVVQYGPSATDNKGQWQADVMFRAKVTA